MLRLLLFGEQFAVLSKEDLLYGLVRYIVVLYLQIFNGHKIIFFSKSQLRVYSSLDVHLNVFVLKRVHLLNYQIPEFNGPKHNYSSNDYKTVDGLYQWALINMALSGFRVMHLSAAIPGVNPGTYGGIARGLLTFVANLTGALDCFCTRRGKIHGERPAGFVTSRPS